MLISTSPLKITLLLGTGKYSATFQNRELFSVEYDIAVKILTSSLAMLFHMLNYNMGEKD